MFHPVNKLSQYKINIPITIKVSAEYVQVMTVRKQEFLYGVTTVINDVYLVTEIEDITIVSNTRNQELVNEFHFKYNKGKSHHVFTSMKREAIVNVRNIFTDMENEFIVYQLLITILFSIFHRPLNITKEDWRWPNQVIFRKELSDLMMYLEDY